MKIKTLPAYVTCTKIKGAPEKAYLVAWVSSVALYQCEHGHIVARTTDKGLIEQGRSENVPIAKFRRDGLVYNPETDGKAREEEVSENDD